MLEIGFILPPLLPTDVGSHTESSELSPGRVLPAPQPVRAGEMVEGQRPIRTGQPVSGAAIWPRSSDVHSQTFVRTVFIRRANESKTRSARIL